MDTKKRLNKGLRFSSQEANVFITTGTSTGKLGDTFRFSTQEANVLTTTLES
jgi:hypothetical protein